MLTQILQKAEKKESWEEFYADAKKYHKTADGGLKRRAVFTAEILYNIYAMAIEKYFMGFSVYYNDLPYNHTFRDFAETIVRIDGKIEDQMSEDLGFMDSFQEICSVEFYERKEPCEEDLVTISEVCNRVRNFVDSKLPDLNNTKAENMGEAI